MLLAVGCNSASEPRFGEIPSETMYSIARLKALCDGDAAVIIAQDATIQGQVIANDLYGEFDREIVIQDDSGGITIAIDDDRLADRFPFGAVVTVRCNGLVLRDYGGKIKLGTLPGQYDVGRIPAEEIDRYFRIFAEPDGVPRENRLRFSEITFSHIDTRVRFDNIRFLDTDCAWCDTDPDTSEFSTTERMIANDAGETFSVRTLWCCDYAGEPLPEGTGSLVGVIDYFGGKYALQVTFHEKEFADGSAGLARYEGGGSAGGSGSGEEGKEAESRAGSRDEAFSATEEQGPIRRVPESRNAGGGSDTAGTNG